METWGNLVASKIDHSSKSEDQKDKERKEKVQPASSQRSIWDRGNEEELLQRYGLDKNSREVRKAQKPGMAETEYEEKIIYHPLRRKYKFGYLLQYPWEALIRNICDMREEPKKKQRDRPQPPPHRGPIRIMFDPHGRPIIVRPRVTRSGFDQRRFGSFGRRSREIPFEFEDFRESSDEMPGEIY